ncbi:MAG TPA: inositol monophosphatase family protein [Anaerolineales bacterium]
MQPTLADLESLARGAGEILRGGYPREHQINYKGVIDLVTEVDHQSEAYLLEQIRGRFPDSHILTEESGEIRGGQGGMWYVDPLDGTVNYAHQIPIFSVSLAYAAGKSVKLGVVYDPMRDEMFAAERGRGATLNGRPIRPSQVTDLQHSLMVTGFPYDAWNTRQDNFENFVRISKLTQGVRRLGSAALDAAYVGAGRFDAFWELSLKPWDIAAGGLIASESGASVTNIDGEADYISPPQSVICAAPNIHRLLMDALQKV